MSTKLAVIPFVFSLVFAGSVIFSQPASAGDGWGFSLGGNGIGFHYDDHDRHHRHHGHHYRHHNYHAPRYYHPHRYHGYRYYQPYRYYTPRYYYPSGGLSFHFD